MGAKGLAVPVVIVEYSLSIVTDIGNKGGVEGPVNRTVDLDSVTKGWYPRGGS